MNINLFYLICSLWDIATPPANIYTELMDYILHICIKGDVNAFSSEKILIFTAYCPGRPMHLVWLVDDGIDRASRRRLTKSGSRLYFSQNDLVILILVPVRRNDQPLVLMGIRDICVL